MKIAKFDLKKTIEPEKKTMEEFGKAFETVSKGGDAAKSGRKFSALLFKGEDALKEAGVMKEGRAVRSWAEAKEISKVGKALSVPKVGLAIAGAVALGAALRPKDKGYDAIAQGGQSRA